MQQPFLKKAGILLAVGILLWILSRYLLPIFLPFLLAGLLALAAEPLVRVFRGRLHLPQWAATGVGVTIALLVAVLLVVTLCAFLLRELGMLARVMPNLEDTARQGMESLEGFLLDTAERTPSAVRPVVKRGVENLFSDGGAMLDRVSGSVLRMASGVVTRIPDSALGLGTWLIATFMISARLPQLRTSLESRLPPSWYDQYLPAFKQLRSSFAGWLIAQLKLSGITCLVLSLGFLLLRIPNGILWAVVVSFLDALPVLGTGTVLVPWSLISFLQGDPVRAVGLLAVFIVVMVLRSVLEPKLLGKQLGLDPLVTLLALYTGFRIWGVPGMILAPLLAVAATQLLLYKKQQGT